MASRFWVGGSGDLDGSTTTHIAASSGGAGGASYPGPGDTMTFDGASGGGTVTASADHTWQSMTSGAFTGTLDWSTNNKNMTLTLSGNAMSTSGSGIRTLRLGNGIWLLPGANAAWAASTTTNLTFAANSSTIKFTGDGARAFAGGGLTFNAVVIDSATLTGSIFNVTSNNSFASLTINAPNNVTLAGGGTQTVTTLTVNGTSASQVFLRSNSTTAAGISVAANAPTITWGALQLLACSGGATFAASNSFDGGGNTSITITAPSGGAGGLLGSANLSGGML